MRRFMNRFGVRAVSFGCVLSLAACAFCLGACSAVREGNSEQASQAAASSSAVASSSGVASKYLETVSSDTYDAAVEQMDLEYTDRDLKQDPDTSDATSIVFSGADATIEGEGASVAEGVVTISEEGCYVLSGSFQGQVMVSCPEDAKVQIVLDGASIECSNAPAIDIEQADKAFVTTAAGSQNSLSDGAEYASEEDEPYGAVFSRADLTINGSGSLKVTGLNRHGISSKDDLVVTGGSIEVEAVEDALHGKDCVKIADGELVLQAGEDAIKSTNSNELETRGFVVIDGGSISASAGNDGIHAESVMAVNGGTIDISTCEEGFEGQKVFLNSGETRIAANDDGLNASSSGESSSTPVPGQVLEGCLIEVNGGYHVIKSEGDGVDSNGTLTFNGGITLVSGPVSNDDSAIDSEQTPVVNGGVVMAAGSMGMASDFSSEVQPFASVQVKGSAGQSLAVVDASGNLLLSFTPQSDFELIQVTTPAFEESSACQILLGASVDTANADGYADDSTGGSASGGEASSLTPSLESSLKGANGGFGGGPGGSGGQDMKGGQMQAAPGSGQAPDGDAGSGKPSEGDTGPGHSSDGQAPEPPSGAKQEGESAGAKGASE